MNSLYVLSFVLALAVHAHGEGYTTVNDSFDMKAAVAKIEILEGLVGCFLDTHPCSEAAAAYKKIFPDGVATACSKCNDVQKGQMHTFLVGVKEKLPTKFEELKSKFDPQGEYFVKLEANVAAY